MVTITTTTTPPARQPWRCPACGCGCAAWVDACPRCAPATAAPPAPAWPFYPTPAWPQPTIVPGPTWLGEFEIR